MFYWPLGWCCSYCAAQLVTGNSEGNQNRTLWLSGRPTVYIRNQNGTNLHLQASIPPFQNRSSTPTPECWESGRLEGAPIMTAKMVAVPAHPGVTGGAARAADRGWDTGGAGAVFNTIFLLLTAFTLTAYCSYSYCLLLLLLKQYNLL